MTNNMLNLWNTIRWNGLTITVLAGSAALALLILILFVTNLLRKRAKERLNITMELIHSCLPKGGLEHNLNLFLKTISQIVDASCYAFYIQDSRSKLFTLKAVRKQGDDLGQIAPSYSGLLPHKKEQFLPPLSIDPTTVLSELALVKEGEVPLLSIPVGPIGLIRIGPMSKLKRYDRNRLIIVKDVLQHLTKIAWESDSLQLESEVVVTSAKALQAVGSVALISTELVKKISTMLKTALGLEKILVSFSPKETNHIPVMIGWTDEMQRSLRKDTEWLRSLWDLKKQARTKAVILPADDPRIGKFKEKLSGGKGARLLLAEIPQQQSSGLLVGVLPSAREQTESHLLDSVRITLKELEYLIQQQNSIKAYTTSYAELLKTMARTIDNLSPYTIGYSELMSRYSIIIAQEMGLSAAETQDIALAAFLSNIGVLGLTEELYLKEGKFSEIEFEKMKLHAEVGASIVDMTLGNVKVSSYIRYHHERIDGNGYPYRLKKDEIPTGAQIIAVVQTFLAKINGRKYREPLPFDKAMQILQSAAGTQLSADAVQAFTQWFRKKQTSTNVSGRSLGPCWEMCCVPSQICESCPAYKQTQIKCWESSANNCQAHGKTCKTCYVYTENLSRSISGR